MSASWRRRVARLERGRNRVAGSAATLSRRLARLEAEHQRLSDAWCIEKVRAPGSSAELAALDALLLSHREGGVCHEIEALRWALLSPAGRAAEARSRHDNQFSSASAQEVDAYICAAVERHEAECMARAEAQLAAEAEANPLRPSRLAS